MIGNSNRQNTNPTPFGLSLSFDRLRMIGNTNTPHANPFPVGLSLSKDKLSPFDRLRMHGHFDKLSASGVFVIRSH
jgi:hypothetical protein